MQLSNFSYDVPKELIADVPPSTRGTSRLLVLDKKTGEITDRRYSDIVDYFNPGDVLVLNDTKVIKARLITKKPTGGERELVLVEKHGTQDDWFLHKVIYRRKLKAGDILTIGEHSLEVVEILGDGIALIRSAVNLLDISEKYGTVPLPPYMGRDATKRDIERYQTVFAREQGSVAAPTASLNMTEEILTRLREKGVIIAWATLHVGLGTFLPIRVDDVTKHKMHQEYFSVPKETIEIIQQAKKQGKRVVALGTTITRTLEYAANDILHNPPRTISGEADIFIYPSYKFQVIDGLITNFHLPESTVLMLAAAFASWDFLRPAYEHAVREQYHFFSYGDSMLIM